MADPADSVQLLINAVEACVTALTPDFEKDPTLWQPTIAKVQEAGNCALEAKKLAIKAQGDPS